MNYYLVPQFIAESLQLTRIRKSSAGGFYLLSEYDLQPYGIERSIEEGAIELSENHTPVPVAEPEQTTDNPPQGNQQAEPTQEIHSEENQPLEDQQEEPAQEEESEVEVTEETEEEVEEETKEEEES